MPETENNKVEAPNDKQEKQPFAFFVTSTPLPDSLKSRLVDANGKSIEELKDLSKINILVGPNNSGKSFIMRELFKQESLAAWIPDNSRQHLKQELKNRIALFYNSENASRITKGESETISAYTRSGGVWKLVDKGKSLVLSTMEEWGNLIDTMHIKSFYELLVAISTHIHTVDYSETYLCVSKINDSRSLEEKFLSRKIVERITTWLLDLISLVEPYYNDNVYHPDFSKTYIHYFRSIDQYAMSETQITAIRNNIVMAYDYGEGKRFDNLKEYINGKEGEEQKWVLETGFDMYKLFAE